jgi:hypothetical protein
MNERIKELLDQSGIKVKSDLSGFSLPEDINLYHAQGFDLEKFAELIVQECAMIVEGFTFEWEVADDQYQDYEASDVLKKHFGVER